MCGCIAGRNIYGMVFTIGHGIEEMKPLLMFLFDRLTEGSESPRWSQSIHEHAGAENLETG